MATKPETYLLLNTFGDRVEKALSNKQKENTLFRHIMKFRDNNIEYLSSPYPLPSSFVFSKQDQDIIFELCEIREEEVREVSKSIVVPGLTKPKENFTPFRAIMILILRYYFLKKDQKKAQIIYMYYAFSMYPSIHYKFFSKRGYSISEEIMEFTINNMSGKFLLKQTGSVEGALLKSCENTVTERYYETILNSDDLGIIEVIDALKTRQNSLIKNIMNQYVENEKNRDRVYTQSEFGEDGSVIDRGSTSGDVEALSNEYTQKFFATAPSSFIINQAAQFSGKDINKNELKTALYLLQKNEKIEEVKKFYEALFTIFLNEPNTSVADLKSLKFVITVDAIYRKGNSIDKNVLAIKKLSHKWLHEGSATYRATNRQATLNAFRKGIYF